MLYAALKLVITSVLIVAISEAAKRSNFLAAVLASLPLVSVLAMIWLYIDTQDVTKIASLSHSIFWLVLPSLVLFVALPVLLRYGVGFYASLAVSVVLTAAAYWLMVVLLARAGISL